MTTCTLLQTALTPSPSDQAEYTLQDHQDCASDTLKRHTTQVVRSSAHSPAGTPKQRCRACTAIDSTRFQVPREKPQEKQITRC
jgi:hypothetical protein